MFVMFGYSSKIAEAVRNRLDRGEVLETFQSALMDEPPLQAERYLFCAGVLVGRPIEEMHSDQVLSMLDVNFASVARACELILSANSKARICVVGSESGVYGSFDRVYAGSKAALHNYVETRRVGPEQQLVCIAPSIISDAGMTLRRTDALLAEKAAKHPKGRFLLCEEVAREIVHVLYGSSIFLTNTVIHLHGGEFTR